MKSFAEGTEDSKRGPAMTDKVEEFQWVGVVSGLHMIESGALFETLLEP